MDLSLSAKNLFVVANNGRCQSCSRSSAALLAPIIARLCRQLRRIRHFPDRWRVVGRSPDDRATGFHLPIAPTNRIANASPQPGSRRKNLPRYRSGRSFGAPAVAAFPLGIALPQPPRWNDALRIALVATAVVVHRPCVVSEADDCPAANRTDLNRRHRARSVVCAWAGSTAKR